jgi:hypothetical protein
MKQDRGIAGFIAGASASIVQIIYGHIMKIIGLTDRTFTDFARIFIMYKEYPGVASFFIGFITQIILGSILGTVFAFYIKKNHSNYLYLKGVSIGTLAWLLFGISGTVAKLPLFYKLPPKPAIVTFVGALIYGIALAYFLNLLEKKSNLI